MPIYDYHCAACGPFEARRPMRESSWPHDCGACGHAAPRVPSATRLNLMPGNRRIAETRNEKSAHEPGVVHRLAGHVHDHGHTHDTSTPHGPGHAHRHAGGGHPPSPRPWMLGH